MTDTISWLEIVWTLGAIFGFGVNFVSLYDAYIDKLIALDNKSAEPRLIVASMRIRSEAIRSIVQLLLVAIGISAMFVGSNPASGASVLRGVMATSFLVAEILMIAGSVLDRRDRRRVIDAIRERAAVLKTAEDDVTAAEAR